MSHTVVREALRDGWMRALLVTSPIALALQFVGGRPAAEVALSVVLIAAFTVYTVHAGYRRAETHIAIRREAAEDARVRAARVGALTTPEK